MRSILLVLAVALAPSLALAQASPPGVEDVADALEARARTLQRGTWDLGSRVGDSHRRLAAIELAMRGEVGGARVEITQVNHAGVFVRLVEATYAIDGQEVFHARDDSGALGRAPLEVRTGSIAPGTHTLTVVLRYAGDGQVFQYLEGYRFRVRSSHTFTVPDGQQLGIRVDAYEHPERAYTERLDVVYVEHLEPMR